ncbi:hypothetical protein B0H14DRAFT_210490 [Mycena olivaceomarginata]|nr:hypothetical protein B0H14DRAFT_210490 [Mycena olivaceomarginata]
MYFQMGPLFSRPGRTGNPITYFPWSEEKRIHITFAVVKLAWDQLSPLGEGFDRLFREFIATIGPELAHNPEPWACVYCGVPTTDFAWTSVYDPRSIGIRCKAFINPGCDKCVHDVQEAAVKNLKRQIDEFDSVPVVIGGIPRPDEMNGGLSATCLTCQNEETATPGFPMSQCGKCKLVRYCSAGCQTQDWARHKKVCAKIQTVNRIRGWKVERETPPDL